MSHRKRKLSAPTDKSIFSCLLMTHLVTKLWCPPMKDLQSCPFSMSKRLTMVSFAHEASQGFLYVKCRSLTGKK